MIEDDIRHDKGVGRAVMRARLRDSAIAISGGDGFLLAALNGGNGSALPDGQAADQIGRGEVDITAHCADCQHTGVGLRGNRLVPHEDGFARHAGRCGL